MRPTPSSRSESIRENERRQAVVKLSRDGTLKEGIGPVGHDRREEDCSTWFCQTLESVSWIDEMAGSRTSPNRASRRDPGATHSVALGQQALVDDDVIQSVRRIGARRVRSRCPIDEQHSMRVGAEDLQLAGHRCAEIMLMTSTIVPRGDDLAGQEHAVAVLFVARRESWQNARAIPESPRIMR